MRYSGGLLGGSWLTALAGDLGHGKFDGAWLVQNFENQNPANTLWSKQYNLYSKIDTEAPRYLGFERWWGGHVNLNAEEIQFIVDELFVGNKLAAGEIKTSDGTAIDLRNIRSPIVVFCSKGDNITPPQQALGWILDLYDDVDEIRSYGQTIVYTIHEVVGHLGHLRLRGWLEKQHGEFSSNIDLIDALPPGLYEAVFEAKSEDTAKPRPGDRQMGDALRSEDAWTTSAPSAATMRPTSAVSLRRPRFRDQSCTLPDVCAAAGARMVGTPLAEWMHRCTPCGCSTSCFSDENPMMAPVADAGRRGSRKPKAVAGDNPFVAMQETASRQIVAALDAWRELTEAWPSGRSWRCTVRRRFRPRSVSILLATRPLRKAAKSPLHRELLQKRIAELKAGIPAGGLRAAVIRGLLYAGMTRAAIDERGFEALRRIRQTHTDLPLSAFKTLVREQFNMLLIDRKPRSPRFRRCFPPDAETRRKAFDLIRQVLAARGSHSSEERRRIERGRPTVRHRRPRGLTGSPTPFRCPKGTPGKGIVGRRVRSRRELMYKRYATKGAKIGAIPRRSGLCRAAADQVRAADGRGQRSVAAANAIVVHPCDETSLRGPIEAAEIGLIVPILVGPAAKIPAVAREHGSDRRL